MFKDLKDFVYIHTIYTLLWSECECIYKKRKKARLKKLEDIAGYK